MELRQIDAAIRGIHKRYENARDAVQTVAVAIVEHAAGKGNGDCSRAANLCRALPNHLRRSLVVWFQQVSPINVTMGKTAKDDTSRLRKDDSKLYNPFNIDKARALNWYDNPNDDNPADEPNIIYGGGVFEDIIKQLDRMLDNKGKKNQYSEDAQFVALSLKRAVRKAQTAYLAAKDASAEPTTVPAIPVNMAA